jgi:hypothetical protein
MSRSQELQPDELELVSGGGSTKLFSEVTVGTSPSHHYGMISDSFGANMSFDQVNAALQRFNAPTHDALYGQGNDPNATAGTVARPGAQDLHGLSTPWGTPLDSGGNVTLQHGDGYAVNTTVPGEHMVEGTLSRNLVVDYHDGGGYQTMSLGQGHDGAQLATAIGTAVGAKIGGAVGGPAGEVLGGALGGDSAQNLSHLVNPDIGAKVFGQLDDAMHADINGTHNPNLDLPSGRTVELGYVADALAAGKDSALGHSPVAHFDNVQDQAVAALGHDLNSQGPVTGYFSKSSNEMGIYHVTPEGTKYYEMDNGHVVEKQLDEMSGVDRAISHQAELNAQHPPSSSDGDIHLPDPPAPINELPPELTPHDGNTPSGPDHTENVGSTQFVDAAPHSDAADPAVGIGAMSLDTGSHAADTGNHGMDVAIAPIETAPVMPVDTAPMISVDIPPVMPVDTAPVIPIDIPSVVQFPMDVPVIAPIQIPVFDAPPVISGAYSDMMTSGAYSDMMTSGAYSDMNPIPVVTTVDAGIDTGIAGIGSLDVGGGYDVGGFDMGGYDAGGFDAGGFGSFDA